MTSKQNSNKRIDSTKKYIDALSKQHSKLNVVRIDLGYKKPYSDDITLNEATKDIDRMFNNMRNKQSIFKDKVGYVLKKEYTKEKGVHVHAIFLYDGQKVQKDAYKADQIGKYGQELTQNIGSYYNCNRNSYPEHGIGMLDHRDEKKRKNLDKAISYLCKDEQSVGSISNKKKDRSFTRGTIPKSKGNIGRPRD